MTRAARTLAMVLSAAVLLTRPAAAALSETQRLQILEEANDAYTRALAVLRSSPGDAVALFSTAARRFQQLADDGVVNAKLEYNLGNSYLQGGDLGRAILHYRKAQQLSPGDPRLRHNLEYARTLVRSQIAPSAPRALTDALLSWHRRLPLRVRYWAFLAAWIVVWAALGLNMFAPRPRWRWAAAVASALCLPAGASVAADVFRGAPREGVVLADDVVVRKGNSVGFEPQFQEALHPGVEFRLLEERSDWLLIELPDGKTGWIPAAAAGLIS
jgi:tetratricopeptide (TPR) repeat protein